MSESIFNVTEFINDVGMSNKIDSFSVALARMIRDLCKKLKKFNGDLLDL
jgi:hypothetical protein